MDSISSTHRDHWGRILSNQAKGYLKLATSRVLTFHESPLIDPLFDISTETIYILYMVIDMAIFIDKSASFFALCGYLWTAKARYKEKGAYWSLIN